MKTFIHFKYAISIAFLLALTACSSHIPAEIANFENKSPGLASVQNTPNEYISRNVRWGGIILNTEIKKNSSQLTIIAYPLTSNGEPQISQQSTGRFIAIVNGFLEPTIYATEREITFIGNISGSETHKIGEFDYIHPLIKVEHYYLWPLEPDYDEADYPPYWWHDPWYRPYYPHRHIH